MSTYIGDIHENIQSLNDILDQINRGIQKKDTIIFLGDYLDNGNNTKERIELILNFQKSSSAQTVFWAGNHEE